MNKNELLTKALTGSYSEAITKAKSDERKRIVGLLRTLELELARTEGQYLAPENQKAAIESLARDVARAVGNGIGYARECLNVAINEIEKK